MSLSVRQLLMALDSNPLDYLYLIGLVSRLLSEAEGEVQLHRSTIALSRIRLHISPSRGKHMSTLWRSFFSQVDNTDGNRGGFPLTIPCLPPMPEITTSSEQVGFTSIDVLGIIVSLQNLSVGKLPEKVKFQSPILGG